MVCGLAHEVPPEPGPLFFGHCRQCTVSGVVWCSPPLGLHACQALYTRIRSHELQRIRRAANSSQVSVASCPRELSVSDQCASQHRPLGIRLQGPVDLVSKLDSATCWGLAVSRGQRSKPQQVLPQLGRAPDSLS